MHGIFQRRRCKGQSIIESALVIMVMSMICLGVLQVSQLFMAQEVLHNAAASGARAKAVGFNNFMIDKVVRAATIPTAGRITNPVYNHVSNFPAWRENGNTISDLWNRALYSGVSGTAQSGIEVYRIPMYLGANSYGELGGILDYEDWDTVDYPRVRVTSSRMARVTVGQDFPLKFPLHRAFYADDEMRFQSQAEAGHYAEAYLE